MYKIRLDHEEPECIASWGWKFHHIGIPTNEKKENERHVPGCFVSGFNTNPFGIEWMRFEQGSKTQELIQKVPHVAFEVKNLDWELENRGFNVISPPCVTADGIREAMIEYNGAPVQLFEFVMNK